MFSDVVNVSTPCKTQCTDVTVGGTTRVKNKSPNESKIVTHVNITIVI